MLKTAVLLNVFCELHCLNQMHLVYSGIHAVLLIYMGMLLDKLWHRNFTFKTEVIMVLQLIRSNSFVSSEQSRDSKDGRLTYRAFTCHWQRGKQYQEGDGGHRLSHPLPRLQPKQPG